jgi:hypothetical protein
MLGLSHTVDVSMGQTLFYLYCVLCTSRIKVFMAEYSPGSRYGSMGGTDLLPLATRLARWGGGSAQLGEPNHQCAMGASYRRHHLFVHSARP